MSTKTLINGIKILEVIITPNCRTRGDSVAFRDACQRLNDAWDEIKDTLANKEAIFHMALTVERPSMMDGPKGE